MDKHSESQTTDQKTVEMLTEENGSRSNQWAEKHDDANNGSPAMSVGSSASGSNKSDFEYCVGQKIEVRDYRTDMWYLAKIMEVDHDDREIFIHYEKWSQRFDEWMKWDSQRIRRACTTVPTSQFKIGDSVMATWNYTKKYPAVIQNILPDDKYEVKFYDGFVKVIKGNRITELNPNIAQSIMSKLPKDKPPAPPVGSELDVRNIGTKAERREKKRRINVAEIFHPNSAAAGAAKRRKVDEVAEGGAVALQQPEVTAPPSRERSGRRSRGGRVVAVKEEPVTVAPAPAVKKDADRKRRSSRHKEEPKIDDKGGDVEANAEQKAKDVKEKTEDEVVPGFEPEKYPLEPGKSEGVEMVKMKGAVVMVEKVEPTDNNRGSVVKETSSTESKTDLEKEERSEAVQASDNKGETNQSAEAESVKTPGNEIAVTTQEKKSLKDVRLKDILPNIAVNRSALRRIRIPKVKTSLGSLTSSTFPRVKIGPLPKMHSKSLTSRGGRVIKKKLPGGGFDVRDVPGSISKTNVVEDNSEKMKDSENLSSSKIPKIADQQKVDNAESELQETAASEPKMPDIDTDMADKSHKTEEEEERKEQNGVIDDGTRRRSKKKKGKRMRHGRSKHKSDDSGDMKGWKFIHRRKGEEDDDPERWNGDVPHGAKPVFIDGGDGKMRQSIIIPDKKLPVGWTKHTIIRKNSSKWDVLLVNPNGRKFRSRKDLRIYYNELNKDYPEERFDFVVGRTKLTTSLIEQATKSNRSPKHVSPSPRHMHRSGSKKGSGKDLSSNSLASTSASALSPATPVEEKKIKTLLPKAKSTPLASASATNITDEIISPLPTVGLPAPSLPSGKGSSLTTVTPKSGPLEANPLLAAPLSTPLSEDGTGSCQCPKEGCGKNFRKESLLQMHIKHYHPEYSSFLDGALNVADLAYARTVAGEQLDGDSGGGGGVEGSSGGGVGGEGGHSSFLERITKYEQSKAAAAAKAAKAASRATRASEVAAAATPSSHRRRSPAATRGAHSPLRKALTKGLSYSPERTAEDNAEPNKKSLLSGTGTSAGQTKPEAAESTPMETDSEWRMNRLTAADSNDRLNAEDMDIGGCDRKASPGRDLLHGSYTPPPRQKYHSEGATPDSPRIPSNTAYRFARRKPIVSVEKLNVTTDSNGRILLDKKGQHLLKSEKSDSIVDSVELPADAINTTEIDVVDVINKKEEIINCLCGYPEEDGLMIQCDLCLCWQHGLCNSISTDSEVPEKYICFICLNSKHSRSSRKYMHSQEWLKDGKLPVLSFRQHNEEDLQQRETILRQSHELVSSLLQLQTVVKSLRLKTHIAGKSDHPKLYLWSKSWDKDEKDKPDVKKEENEKDGGKETGEEIKKEEKKVPNIPVPEAPIDLVECRLRLLEHIEDYQQRIDDRLSSLDAQVSALEALEPDLMDEETDDLYPRSKQTVQMLLNDLGTLRKVTAFN